MRRFVGFANCAAQGSACTAPSQRPATKARYACKISKEPEVIVARARKNIEMFRSPLLYKFQCSLLTLVSHARFPQFWVKSRCLVLLMQGFLEYAQLTVAVTGVGAIQTLEQDTLAPTLP